ncbi:pyroglutamyl-peptidase [Haloferula luteola]|uniref:Pyroglutamyl-peptidase I n=1 Tax=Haloferula luteola TaxID=595692 RepID=A0A840V314_9BACT|nr:pyroglutamyl-peptidase I [Haloferula luteola]MBB5350054.1 pyroglutamyl-peptidase [Haloferula luteola]
MKKVLLSAFEPFGGDATNTSLQVAEALRNEQIPGVQLQMVELPVVRFEAPKQLIRVIQEERPDLVVMLGEAGGRRGISPERVAINLDDYPIPDNGGFQPCDEAIVSGGPVGYFSTLPLRAILGRWKDAMIPAEISNTAGLYLCNHLFYQVMHYLATQGPSVPAGFVHVPRLREGEVKEPTVGFDQCVDAIRLLVEEVIERRSAWV